MSEPTFWERVKEKFRRESKHEKRVKEFKAKSQKIIRETRIKVIRQITKARAVVAGLKNKDKRRVPLFLLTFEEIEKLCVDSKKLPTNDDQTNLAEKR